MYGSPATSRDLNLTFQAASLKHGKEDADLNHHHHPHHHHHHQQQQTQMSAGLLRYRSAPSSMLGELTDDFLPHRSSSPEAAETMFARFMSPDTRDQIGEKSPLVAAQRSAQLTPAAERGHAGSVAHQQNGGFSSSAASQMAYHPLQQPQQLQVHRAATPVAAMQSSPYRTAVAASSSVAVDNEQVGSGVNDGNLVRHSSSPAGLFSHFGTENGYATMRGMFRPGAGSTGEAMPEGSRLKGQISFSSRQSSSSGLMSPISEIAGDRIGGDGPEDGIGGRCFIPGLPVAAWDDSSFLADGFTGSSRRARDPSEAQNGDVRVHASSLSHHFSLPRTSSEMASILQFQDAVPCKIRAKRGCATHPRSIAERVRRTRISERMRKLQELVPNMDKQTSTADMLDLAVEYIKDLQKQVKSLSESRASCTCSSKHKP